MEKIIWIGGYPHVEGVNIPTRQKPEKAKRVHPIRIIPWGPAGGHDLRGGYVRNTRKP